MKICTKKSRKVISILVLSMFLAFTGMAQSCVITQTSGFVPTWNGQEFCNGTMGYNPSQIDQPVFSAPCSIASYDYEWQKSYDNAAWTPITTGVGASVVPAFDPLVETNTATTTKTVYYRLQVIGNITGGGTTLTTFFSNFTFILRPQVIFTGAPFMHIAGSPSQVTNSVCAGTAVTFTSNISNPITPTYQWQRSAAGGGGIYTNFGAPSSMLNLNTTAATGAGNIDDRDLRVVITEPIPTGGSAGCTYTSPATSLNYVSGSTGITTTAIPNPAAVCAGLPTAAITFASTGTGTPVLYEYVFSGDNIGQPLNSDTVVSTLPSFTATNTSATVKTAIVTVRTFRDADNDGIADFGECVSSTKTFNIVVKPIPNAIATASTQNICPSAMSSAVALSSGVSGTTFTWSVTNPGGTLSGFTAAGSGASIAAATIAASTPKILDSVVYTITPTAAGCAGPTTTAVIYVVDSTKPIITPITDITGNTTAGTCAKTVSMGLSVTATDNCDMMPSIAHEVSGATTLASTAGQLSSFSFNKGVSTVTYTVTDGALNVSTSSFTVTISDNEDPSITAPVATTGTTNIGCTSTNVVLGSPTTSDNCPGTITTTNDAPAAFPIGVTTVTWTATDAAGNTSTDTQVVTVTDNINPMITAANDTTVKIQTGCDATVVLNMPTFSDNCMLTATAITNNAPAIFPKGNTTVTWTVTDQAGLTATDIQIVTVLDTIKPVITVPAATTGTSNVGCTSTNVTLGMATATDNCSGTITITNNAPAAFSLGLTVVTWTAEDESGNTIQGFQNVTITDNINPIITAPAATTGTTNVGCTSTNVTLGMPTFSDNCTLASTAVTNDAPMAFPLGLTTVTWTIIDGSGNMATATQDVTVTDDINPTITAPSDIISNTTAGCGAVGLALGTPTFSDNCTLTSTAITNNSTGSYPLGVTTIIWTVTDQAGNTATATQTVTVNDSIKPLIAAISGTTINVDAGLCTATYTLTAPSVIENCTPLASLTNDHPSTTFTLGDNTVTWTATDASGNVGTQTQIITVVDNIAPVFTSVPPTVTFTANSSCAITGVTNGMLGTPAGTDNCLPPSFTVSNLGTYPIGTTTITWTVTDVSGNSSTATQDVVVVDGTNPTITAPANIIVASDPTSCDRSASTVVLGMPTISDNCTLTSTAVVNNSPTTVYALGVNTVTWQVTDGAGNSTTAIQTVTVNDSTAPVATCSPFVINLTGTGTYSLTPADIMTMTTGSTDNCAITARSISQTMFNCSNQGVNTVTLTLTDAAGNTSTCSTTVTVNSSLTSVSAVVNANIACAGTATGNMTISSTGGSGSSVTYSWTGPQTGSSVSLPLGTSYTTGGLLGGTYTITATTSTGCTNTTMVTINQPALALTTTASATNISCHNANDGKITFTYGGGYTGLNVSWSGGSPILSGSFTTSNNPDTFTVTNLNAGTYTITVSDNAPGAPLCTVTASAVVVNPPALGSSPATYTQVNNTCFGGMTGSIDVTITATGGTGAIIEDYIWAKDGTSLTYNVEDPTGLGAGTYYLNLGLKDANNCTYYLINAATVVITQPTEIMPTLASTNPLCNGGSTGTITASATGGTGAYTYQLGSGTYQTTGAFTGQAAGTYTVNVKDANGCIKSASVTLTDPAAISAITQTGSTTNVNCFGASTGAFVVSAIGGTAPLTYSITGGSSNTSGSFTGLAAGTYAVTATDANGCVKTGLSITVIQPSTALAATLVQTSVVSCNNGSNGSITADAGTSGTASYTYVIAGPTVNTTGASSGIFTGLASGAYTVTVTDAKGCTFTTSSVTLANPSALTIAQVGTTTNVLCNGASTGAFTVAAAGGIGSSFTYTKTPMGGTQATPGVWTALPAGTYTATATSNLGCVVTATSITITQPTAIVVSATGTNPTCNGFATGQIASSATGGTGTIAFTISGPTVNTTGATSGTFTSLLAGTYTVTATDANNCTKTTNVTLVNPSVLTFSAAPLVVNATCNGTANGSITAIGTGGTPAYTYSLSPAGGTSGSATSGIFGGLAAGSYLVKVTDTKGCFDSSFVTVNQPSMIAITPSVSITNTLCNGNANGAVVLTVNASGGTPGYTTTYLWSNGATTKDISGLVAGTYTVDITVKDASSGTCQKTFTNAISATVTSPAVLTPSAPTVTNVTCFGGNNGSIQLATVGGTGTKTFVMTAPPQTNTTGLFTGLLGGNYNFTITDANGCSTTQAVTVNTPTLAVPDVVPALITGSTNFNTPTTSRNMVILVSELNGNNANGFSILVSKNAGYNVTLPNSTSIVTSGGPSGTHVVDNPNWTLVNFDAFNYLLTYTPSTPNLTCQQSKKVGLTITRATTNIGLFSITVTVGGVVSETNFTNNSTVKTFSAN